MIDLLFLFRSFDLTIGQEGHWGVQWQMVMYRYIAVLDKTKAM